MAALQCEICGGKLMGKPGGVFECDSCGMEYSTEWAKAKIQEIRGTVQVEGTVQVQGTVRVEGGINKDALLKRGDMALTDRQWESALGFFDQALNTDAECSDAYLGRALACCRIPGMRALEESEDLTQTSFAPNQDFYRAMEYGSESQRARLQTLLNRLERDQEVQKQEAIQQRIRQREAEEAQRRKEEEQRQKAAADRAEHIARNLDTVRKVRQWIAPVQHMLQASEEAVSAIDEDSNLWVFSSKREYRRTAAKGISQVAACSKNLVFLMTHGQLTAIENTVYHQVCRDIKAVTAADRFTAALTKENTVKLVHSSILKVNTEIAQWQNITAIAACGNVLAALKADGTALAVFVYPEKTDDERAINVSAWQNMVQVVVRKDAILGLRDDGTVLSTNPRIQAQVESWLDIVAIASSKGAVVGLRCNGTVVSTEKYDNAKMCNWKNIVAIASGYGGIYALGTNGQILSTGNASEVAEIRLFEHVNHARCQIKINQLKMQRQQLGIFGSSQVKKALDAQIAALEAKLPKP